MKKLYLLFVILTAAVVLPGPVNAQTDAGNAEAGKVLFMKQNCFFCHGTAGQGGRDGARIAQTVLNAQGLIRYVRRPTGGMPAFTEKLISDQELTDILAYLKSLQAAKAPKDIPLLNQLQ